MAFTVSLGFVLTGVGDWQNEMSWVLKIPAIRQLLAKISRVIARRWQQRAERRDAAADTLPSLDYINELMREGEEMISRPPGSIPLCSSWQPLSLCLRLLQFEGLASSFAWAVLSASLSHCLGSSDLLKICYHVEEQADVSFSFSDNFSEHNCL